MGRAPGAHRGRTALIPALALLALVAMGATPSHAQEARMTAKIEVTSPAFREGETIPQAHTCDGADRSPALSWGKPPEGTRSIALICEDPDAPVGLWVHWVIWGISPDSTSLPEGVAKDESLADHARQGANDFKRIGYGGPCPPRGKPHRYFFKLYALDAAIDLAPGATRKQLLDAMNGHVIGEGQLMGLYARKG